jgi:molecular chaperone DnaK
MASGNKSLGEFNLEGIPPAPRGTPQIEVSVRHRRQRHPARARKDKGTGKETRSPSRRTRACSSRDPEMVKDAELNAAETKEARAPCSAQLGRRDASQRQEELGRARSKLDAGEKEKIEAALKASEEIAQG